MASGIFLKFGGKTFSSPEAGLAYAASSIKESWGGQVHTVKQVLREYLDSVARELANKHGGAWPGGTSSDSLSSRTGSLAKSIIRSVNVKGTTWETLTGIIGGNRYLAIHEYGGTIKSKGKLMTIPLPAALSSRGTSPPFARQWKNTFVTRSRAGNLIIFQRRGAGVVPLYVLKSEVYIPPRLGMREEMEDQLPYFAARAADQVVRDFVKKLKT